MIYLDDSATTQIDERVLKSMMPYFLEFYGNASSTHSFGQKSKFAIDEARYTIARYINSTPQEIVFTSSGSESISLAIKGTAEYLAQIDGEFHPEHVYLITSPMEHSAIINTIGHLAALGYKNKLVGLEKNGRVIISSDKNSDSDTVTSSLENILEQITHEDESAKIIVSVQYVNSETGTIQDISQISQLSHKYNAIVHTDAMQATKLLDISINNLGVDLMTFAAHKIYGPIGAAVLYIKAGSKISRQIDGGEQEYKIRAGTQNTPAIVGFGKSIEYLSLERQERLEKISYLSSLFIEELQKNISDIVILSEDVRMPSIISVLFSNIKATEFLVRLDIAGIMASAGSACNSGSIQPTANLKYLGLTDLEINSVIRFSIGKNNTKEEVYEATKIISEEYIQYIRNRKN